MGKSSRNKGNDVFKLPLLLTALFFIPTSYRSKKPGAKHVKQTSRTNLHH